MKDKFEDCTRPTRVIKMVYLRVKVYNLLYKQCIARFPRPARFVDIREMSLPIVRGFRSATVASPVARQQARPLLSYGVRPSVCPSVTFVYCVETSKHILKPFFYYFAATLNFVKLGPKRK